MSVPAPSTSGRGGTGVFSPTRARIAARTLRTDRYWVPQFWTVLGLSAFIIYGLVRTLVRTAYYVPRLSLPDAVLLAMPEYVVRAGREPLRHAVR